jgi:hypothetical protein
MAAITGGCLCGKVRFESDEMPAFQGVCHCRDCQKQGGTAFSVVVAFPETALKVTGAMKTYRSKGSSGGEVQRKFCPECGSPILSVPPDSTGLVFLKAGCLDDTSILAPMVHVWCGSKRNWVTLPEGAMTFDQAPS